VFGQKKTGHGEKPRRVGKGGYRNDHEKNKSVGDAAAGGGGGDGRID